MLVSQSKTVATSHRIRPSSLATIVLDFFDRSNSSGRDTGVFGRAKEEIHASDGEQVRPSPAASAVQTVLVPDYARGPRGSRRAIHLRI